MLVYQRVYLSSHIETNKSMKTDFSFQVLHLEISGISHAAGGGYGWALY